MIVLAILVCALLPVIGSQPVPAPALASRVAAAGGPTPARLMPPDGTPRITGTRVTGQVESPHPAATTLEGTATWYCSASSACTAGYGPSDLVGAIDPTLGIGKGANVTVTHDGRSVTVKVVDVCACAGRRLIDLTSGAFSRLAPLSAGVIDVTLTTTGPSVTVPPTDVTP